MKPSEFARPAQWQIGAQIGIVVSVQDPEARSRVQVYVPSVDGAKAAPNWARVAVPFAGDNYGAFLIPNVGDEVIVLYIGGDVSYPVVVGTLWNGGTKLPESIGGDRIDRWTLTGKNGTRIAIVEQATGQEQVEIETPAGNKATLTDTAGGSITVQTSTGTSVTLNTTGVAVKTSGEVNVSASTATLTAGSVTVNSAMSTFSGMITCDTLIANSVVSVSYTPGAGNIW
jgi:uncharacterized protein involved in type VI secretion and phage assembly